MPTSEMNDGAAAGNGRCWWERPGLGVVKGRLGVAGQDAEALARAHGSPLYVYDLESVRENVRELGTALTKAGLTHRIRFAIKANREPQILAVLRSLGAPGTPESVGIDACSPGEVLHALGNGWSRSEISFTGTNVSDRDFDILLGCDVHINVDSISQLKRLGRRAPGRHVGIRVNTSVGVGYLGAGSIPPPSARPGSFPPMSYTGEKPTKFGIYAEQLEEAVEVARSSGLRIDTLHFHSGSGWMNTGLPAFEAALVAATDMARQLGAMGCALVEVNVGGGLGRPSKARDVRVDVGAYADLLVKHLGPLAVRVGLEPGDFIVKDTAVLLAEVVSVENRRGTTFVGLDVGWNQLNQHFIYRFPQGVVVCRAADAPSTSSVTLAGHINEAGDIFAVDHAMPEVCEGDIVALLNAGGYAQSMWAHHCMRPMAKALFLERVAV